MQTRSSVISSTKYCPHPLGAKFALGINTAGEGLVQIHGARVGFTHGPGAVGLPPSPLRVYDSRVTGGKLTALRSAPSRCRRHRFGRDVRAGGHITCLRRRGWFFGRSSPATSASRT